MARLARKYLVVQATSTAAERAMSKLGLILTKKRLSMENEQLSWKMSQSFISGKDLCVLNTPDGE